MTPQDEHQMVQQELSALLAWANHRIELATLDGTMGDLIIEKIGKISGDQAQQLNAQKTLIPFGVNPAIFVRMRANLLQLTPEEVKALCAPDVFDAKESQMIVWAMRDVVDWLEGLSINEQRYPQLLAKYQALLRQARADYTLAQGAPVLGKVIDMAMDLATARREVKRHEKGKQQ